MAPDFRISGSGSQYNNTHGTQNNNSGPGNQFNASTINYNAQNQSDSKLLADLRVTDPRDDKRRIERRKGGLLRDSYSWILDHEAFVRWQTDTQSSLLWIRGDPGKGKTMLICGIIDELPARMPGWETIYFFCEATDLRLNNAIAVLRSLLYLLLRKRPSLSRFIREEHEYAGKRLFEDANGWDLLSITFSNILQDGGLDGFILVIDALDECTAGLDQLLDFIVCLFPFHVKVIASSRNWLSIEETMATISDRACISLELNQTSVSAAVNRYIRHQVDQLARLKRYDSTTRDEVYDYLSSKADDTFLWVALVTEQLRKTGVSRQHARMKLEEFPQHLDALYNRMLARTWESMDRDLCRRILAVASIVCRPVTLLELLSLAGLTERRIDLETLKEIVGECGCLLTVKDDVVYFVHQSAKDFLFRHALADTMPLGIHREHNLLLSRSLEIMSKTCRRNIYNLKEPGASVENIRTPVPDPLEPARYACVYWAEHIDDGGHMPQLQYRQVYKFLKKHFLHWAEALSLLRSVSGGITSLLKLTQASEEMSEQRLFVQDAVRFIRYYRVAFENCPLQLYSSALVFSPRQSIIRNEFQSQVVNWITKRPVVDKEWSLCLQTLEGHRGDVYILSFSPDGTTLASASSGMIRLWNIFTGQCLRTLQGSDSPFVSIAWSLKGDTLASASLDGHVKLWDKATGRLLNKFHGDCGMIDGACVAFIAGDQQVALGFKGTVEIWDTATGQRVRQFQRHESSIPRAVAFSADGALFASWQEMAVVGLFDLKTGECVRKLDHTSPFSANSICRSASLAFLCEGTRLLTFDQPHGIVLWDINAGHPILRVLQDQYKLVSYSRDGRFLAFYYGSVKSAIMIIDGETGKFLQKVSTTSVSAMSFSIDGTLLISSSLDGMIKIWDLSGLQRHQLHNTRTIIANLPSAATSPKIKTIEKVSSTCPNSLPLSPYDVLKANFKLHVITVDKDPTNKNIGFFRKSVMAVAFSDDGKRVASVSADACFKIWDLATGQGLETNDIFGVITPKASLRYCRNGFQVADCSVGKLRVWGAEPNGGMKPFGVNNRTILSTALSNDGTILASSSSDKTINLWDSATRDCKMTFIVPKMVRYMKFSESGSRLVTDIGSINIEFLSTTGGETSKQQTPEILSSQGFMLSVQDTGIWIQKDSKPILWVPPEYRSSAFDVRGSAIALGCQSGQVLIMEFSSDLSVM